MVPGPMTRPDAIVVGAGVSGLTTAHELARAGLRVQLWSKERPPHTTADVAAAFWYPFLVNPSPRVDAWAATAYERFVGLARDPATGVVMREVFELRPDHEDVDAPEPAWVTSLRGRRPMTDRELDGRARHGRRFFAPVIETPIYMPWLLARVEALGVRLVPRVVDDLAEAFDAAPLVVNATGLGARALTGDAALVPLEGVLVKVALPDDVDDPGSLAVLLDEGDPTKVAYAVPRRRDVVLGGTARPVDDIDRARRRSEADRARDVATVVERCRRLAPQLADQPQLEVSVGYRPYRAEVRLELEITPRGCLAHNYGHGGAGVTLSWGCAADLLQRLHQSGYAAVDAAPRTAS